MKFALVLSVFAIAAVQSVQSASVDIDWIYGMTENEVCVAPGNKISFHFKFKRFSNQREILDGKCFSCTAALETVCLSVGWSHICEETINADPIHVCNNVSFQAN